MTPKLKLETLRKRVEEARDNECAKMKLFENQTPDHVFHRGRMYAFDEVLDALHGDWVLLNSSTEQ